MPLFSSAQNFTVNNGQFVDNSSSGQSGIDILLEASAPEAMHDSGTRTYAPRCFPGTREQYIEDIIQWAIPAINDSPLPLCWTTGAAGVGKSAIAQTSAEKMKSGPLGASFFFSINGQNKPTTFFPSIAYQLAVRFADYREVIDREIRRDKTIVNKTMEVQFQGLIGNPLLELEKQGKGIGKRIAIIIDGLDECSGIGAQRKIIEIVATSAHEDTIPLCWVFFSRPESHIEASFSRENVAILCHKIILPVSSDADSDVESYLRGSFNNFLQSRNISTKPPWPSEDDLKLIVKAVNGLFIYAATVYRFIAQPVWLSLDEPLRAVLGVISEINEKKARSGSTPLSPFAELDGFYLLILRRIPERILPSIRLLLGTVCLQTFPGAVALANLLRLSKIELHTLCAQLSAVLKFQGEDDPSKVYSDHECDPQFHAMYSRETNEVIPIFATITTNQLGGRIDFYHKSFRDFLVDPVRSGEFCVWSPEVSRLLFEHFWRLRVDYEDSYCFQNSELVLSPRVPDSGFSLSHPYENEVVNSHLKVAVYCETIRVWRYLAFDLGPEKLVTADFRKELYIEALLFPESKIVQIGVHANDDLLKYIEGTRLALARGLWPEETDDSQLPLNKFSYLSTSLKQIIEREQEAGVIQPYSPRRDLSSRLTSLFHEKPRDKVESGLYRVGRDSKAIFWFWEINYDKKYYREFRTANLEEGERIYRAEQFDLWKDPDDEVDESDESYESGESDESDESDA